MKSESMLNLLQPLEGKGEGEGEFQQQWVD